MKKLTRSKKNLTPVTLPALALLMVVTAVYFTFVGGGATAVTAAEPYTSGNSPLAWIVPENVSNEPWYDNTTGIAASPLNGAVTVAWEQRDEVAPNDFGRIRQASNGSVGGAFNLETVDEAAWKQIGNVEVAADSQGRRHMVYFRYSGSGSTCGKYAIVEANGDLASVETIPDSCKNNPNWFKVTGIAIGPDDTAHVLLGSNNNYITYFARTSAGQWPVRNELITGEGNPANNMGITASSNGVVMASWLAYPPGSTTADIFTGTRISAGNWQVEDISESCCTGCEGNSLTYQLSIAADNSGGIRVAWIDEECPHTSPRNTDVYYREWKPGTGWNNQPLVLAVGGEDGSQQYWVGITVDSLGKAHIVYGTDAGRGRDDYTLGYTSGSGTVFQPEAHPFEDLFGGAYLKDPSIAHSPGYVHVSFTSDYDDPQKDAYYAHNTIPDSTPTPTATNTPAFTATPVPTNTPEATNTPEPTATSTPRACIDRFEDVCPSDYFYTPALALDDDHVMSGYESPPQCLNDIGQPCFKPYNNITRGQASKIITLGASLPANLEGAPHFTDVPDDSTFYTFIEYAYNAGVVTGYPCGGPGEPCVDNKPYFRPNVDLTRGQISKMVAIAFNFGEPVTTQTFEDVPRNSTFYQWIERMAARGIIGGYPCGAEIEPCVEPDNRPYFRPNNNIIRGQAAKIVYLARQQPPPTATPAPTNTSVPTSTNTAIVPTSTAVSSATSTSIIPTITITIVAGSRP
jgi:hypothetical protein